MCASESWEQGAEGVTAVVPKDCALGECTLVFTAKVFRFPLYTEFFSRQVSHANGDLMANEIVLLFFLCLVLD